MRRMFAASVLAAWAFAAPAAEAMPIAQYDRLTSDDQARYVVLLMNRTIAYLYAQGRDENAMKLTSFYNGDEELAQSAIDDGLETARRRAPRDILITLVRDFMPARRDTSSPRN